MLTLKFSTDNAAFGDADDGEDQHDTDTRSESARLLRELADTLESGSTTHGGIYDVNGNKIGTWRLEGD